MEDYVCRIPQQYTDCGYGHENRNDYDYEMIMEIISYDYRNYFPS